MKLIEKVSYLQGLMDGLEVDESTKDGKVLKQMADILRELILMVDDIQDDVEEVTELCEDLDKDLGELESDYYGCDDDCECECCDECDCDECSDDDDEQDDEDEFNEDELYEVTCPTCNDTICIGEEILLDGSMECPNCGELLEFDLGDDDFLAEETAEAEEEK